MGQQKHIFKKSMTSLEIGAPPTPKNLNSPPKFALTLLKTNLSQIQLVYSAFSFKFDNFDLIAYFTIIPFKPVASSKRPLILS